MKQLILSIVKKISGRPKVSIDTNICVRCGKCTRVCPRSAVTKTPEGTYMILEERCVRCYRCRENCPRQAIRTGNMN